MGGGDLCHLGSSPTCYVVEAGLGLSLSPPASALTSDGIIDVCYHVWFDLQYFQ